jgi:hypothetical protein
MSQKKLDYHIEVKGEYKRTYNHPEEVSDLLKSLLADYGFSKVKVDVWRIGK